MNLQAWWQDWTVGMSPLTRRVIYVGALLVGALLLLQLGRFVFSERSTNPAELEALTFYAERVHNAATFSMKAGEVVGIPLGDCVREYSVGETTVAPTEGVARIMEGCSVGLDNNDRPVVTVTHRDGTVVSVP